jgi:hypothetical protein
MDIGFFEDFGICVDLNGNRMRETSVDWARAPLEFGWSFTCMLVNLS